MPKTAAYNRVLWPEMSGALRLRRPGLGGQAVHRHTARPIIASAFRNSGKCLHVLFACSCHCSECLTSMNSFNPPSKSMTQGSTVTTPSLQLRKLRRGAAKCRASGSSGPSLGWASVRASHTVLTASTPWFLSFLCSFWNLGSTRNCLYLYKEEKNYLAGLFLLFLSPLFVMAFVLFSLLR